MTREPAQHARGGVTALVDSNGWAAQAFASDGSPIPVGGTLHRIISQILHVIFYGQSNAIGVEALPLQPALANSRVLMFAGGVRPWNSTTPDPGTPDYSSLTTLIEEDDANQGGTLHAGETPASGWAMGFMDGITARFGLTLADLNAYLLMSAAGQGSTPAMYLRRDQGYAYPRLVEQQKAGFARAQALGRTFAQSVIHMDLGEADTSLQTSSAEYQRLLLRILTDIERDASTANGRFSPAVMTMCQLSSFNIIGAGTYRDIAYAQAEFARVNPFAILSAPAYMSDYVQTPGGGLHKDGWSNRLSGYYAGRAYAQSLQLDGGGLYFDPDRKFRPTEMLSASRQGPRLVEALFNVPVGPLVFDTTRVSDPGSYGFTIARPGVGVIAISGTPVIHGRNKIIITAAADLRPGDQLIYGAAETPDGSTKRAGRQFGPRGCVADSATDMFDPTGINFRARNYCIHGAVPII
ncbi:hypothetical protein VHN57_08630 [Sphingobium sp. WW5]|uniref:hypothetical protein n=1 Tax=unclassified Sphingobium TaxID=2611147 RepID=UPI003C1F2D0B